MRNQYELKTRVLAFFLKLNENTNKGHNAKKYKNFAYKGFLTNVSQGSIFKH